MTVEVLTDAVRVQPYQYLPQPSEPDYDRLRDSIRDAGGLWPGHEIEVDENGTILDGYTRERICAELDLPCPRRVRTDLTTEDAKFDYIVRVNMARRHLTIEQKRELTQEYLRRFPEKSNRSIAETVGLDHKTVGVQRSGLEASGEIPQTERPHVRPAVEWTDIRQPEATYLPDHKDSTVVTVIINYPMQSEEERTRRGLPYPRESERREWSRELIMGSPTPHSMMDFDALLVELAGRLKSEIRQDLLYTMRVG